MSIIAREIMTTPVISVKENQTIKEVVDLLAQHKFSGVPVVDENDVVVGVLSDTDIVRYSQKISVIPFADMSGWISPHADITDLASLRKGIDLIAKTSVGQVMTKKVHTADENTPITELAVLMSRRRINRVPIVDAAGKLLGIITRADLVHNMAGK
ncbi:MAG: CBS domain-containing protein [Bacillota bacterium]